MTDDNQAIDRNKIETHMRLHTYKNGAMSDCFICEYDSFHQCFHTKEGADCKVIYVPEMRARDRLVIGTNSKRTYLRFSITRFKKDLRNRNPEFEYVGDEDMERYEGISFSPEFANKIKKSISDMGF